MTLPGTALMTATSPRPPASQTPRPRRWRSLLVSAALLGGGAIVVALLAFTPKPPAPTAVVEIPPVNVTVERVTVVSELPDTFELTAVVEPNRIVNVAAEVAGRIEQYGRRSQPAQWQGHVLAPGDSLDEGQPVRAGETLVLLNRELLQARYDRAAAQFEFDEREYRRIQDLFERGSTSRTELDDGRTRRDMARAALDETERELARAEIRAPLAGILNRMPMEIGEYAGPGDVVAEIVELDPVKVVVDVPERDVGYLKIGDPADVLPLGATAPLGGSVTYICALADEGTRTTRVEITVANSNYELRSGQIVRTRLTRRVLQDVLMVPLASVIPLEHGKEVYVVEDGVALRRPVELGFIKGRRVRIVSGLSPGELLVTTGHRLIGAGQAVRIVEGADGAPLLAEADANSTAQGAAAGPASPTAPRPEPP
jgi:membrane fusion protein (multidrug efflux system)